MYKELSAAAHCQKRNPGDGMNENITPDVKYVTDGNLQNTYAENAKRLRKKLFDNSGENKKEWRRYGDSNPGTDRERVVS